MQNENKILIGAGLLGVVLIYFYLGNKKNGKVAPPSKANPSIIDVIKAGIMPLPIVVTPKPSTTTDFETSLGIPTPIVSVTQTPVITADTIPTHFEASLNPVTVTTTSLPVSIATSAVIVSSVKNADTSITSTYSDGTVKTFVTQDGIESYFENKNGRKPNIGDSVMVAGVVFAYKAASAYNTLPSGTNGWVWQNVINTSMNTQAIV